jgi:hypothetical protein
MPLMVSNSRPNSIPLHVKHANIYLILALASAIRVTVASTGLNLPESRSDRSRTYTSPSRPAGCGRTVAGTAGVAGLDRRSTRGIGRPRNRISRQCELFGEFTGPELDTMMQCLRSSSICSYWSVVGTLYAFRPGVTMV